MNKSFPLVQTVAQACADARIYFIPLSMSDDRVVIDVAPDRWDAHVINRNADLKEVMLHNLKVALTGVKIDNAIYVVNWVGDSSKIEIRLISYDPATVFDTPPTTPEQSSRVLDYLLRKSGLEHSVANNYLDDEGVFNYADVQVDADTLWKTLGEDYQVKVMQAFDRVRRPEYDIEWTGVDTLIISYHPDRPKSLKQQLEEGLAEALSTSTPPPSEPPAKEAETPVPLADPPVDSKYDPVRGNMPHILHYVLGYTLHLDYKIKGFQDYGRSWTVLIKPDAFDKATHHGRSRAAWEEIINENLPKRFVAAFVPYIPSNGNLPSNGNFGLNWILRVSLRFEFQPNGLLIPGIPVWPYVPADVFNRYTDSSNRRWESDPKGMPTFVRTRAGAYEDVHGGYWFWDETLNASTYYGPYPNLPDALSAQHAFFRIRSTLKTKETK